VESVGFMALWLKDWPRSWHQFTVYRYAKSRASKTREYWKVRGRLKHAEGRSRARFWVGAEPNEVREGKRCAGRQCCRIGTKSCLMRKSNCLENGI